MSFRKKNISIIPSGRGPPTSSFSSTSPSSKSLGLSTDTTINTTNSTTGTPTHPTPLPPIPQLSPGTRPSPINGHPVTSTGTPTLDALLAGHSGLPLGTSLLIEEPGSTDFAGALLRYYAAEGISQGHDVTVVGFPEAWVRELPGVVGGGGGEGEKAGGEKRTTERMKIAWRYERLGEFGSGIGGSRAQDYNRGVRGSGTGSSAGDGGVAGKDTEKTERPFCHSYDLTKRLSIPSSAAARLHFIPLPPPFSASNSNSSTSSSTSPFTPTSPFPSILSKIRQIHSTTPASTIHRLIIPNLLSPLIYPPHACSPPHILQFTHSLRALLRLYPHQLTIMFSLPLSLHPRESPLTRWIEILSDCVVELTPIPSLMEIASRGIKGKEDIPQGLVKMWKLPGLGEKGGGGAGAGVGMGDDLAFTVTRRRFAIAAFSLPPLEEGEGEGEGGKGGMVEVGSGDGHGKGQTKVGIEF